MGRILLIIPVLWACTFPLRGQGSIRNEDVQTSDSSEPIIINFRFDRTTVDSTYMNNSRALAFLSVLLDDAARVESVSVAASCSPDGNPDYNARLTQRRSEAMAKYIAWRFPALDPAKIDRTTAAGGYWDGLKTMAQADPAIPGREALLKLVGRKDMTDLAKTLQLPLLDGGRTFAYLRKHILPHLRNSTVVVIRYIPRPEIPAEAPGEPAVQTPGEPLPVPAEPETPVRQTQDPVAKYITKYGFALRTNLLTDAVAAPNIGIEVPVGRHFSVAADFTYAYWSIHNRYALQTLQGGVEARYWFRPSARPLTGWNAGLYGMYCDRYDVQWNEGYQGDGYWSAGVLGGYTLPLRGNFALDFSLGAGIWYTPEVRRYSAPENGRLIWEETRYNVTRFSITRARVNLIWLIGRKKEVKQ